MSTDDLNTKSTTNKSSDIPESGAYMVGHKSATRWLNKEYCMACYTIQVTWHFTWVMACLSIAIEHWHILIGLYFKYSHLIETSLIIIIHQRVGCVGRYWMLRWKLTHEPAVSSNCWLMCWPTWQSKFQNWSIITQCLNRHDPPIHWLFVSLLVGTIILLAINYTYLM